MITRTQQIQHIEITSLVGFQEMTNHTDVAAYFKENPENAYEMLCLALKITPLSEELATRALNVDASLDVKNPENLRRYTATLEWTLAKLRNSEKGINLQDLYSGKLTDLAGFVCPDEFKNTGPGDIPLYRAFNTLVICKAADGISPYSKDESDEKIHNSHRTMNLTKGPALDKIKTLVIVHTQNYDLMGTFRPFTEDWLLPRQATIAFLSENEGETCAEEAFIMTNSPEGVARKMGYRGPSLSTGDLVETRTLAGGKAMAHLCMSSGWKTKEMAALEIISHETEKGTMPQEKKSANEEEIPKLPTVEFLGEPCTMEFKAYENGRTAIQLWCVDGPMARATKNIPTLPLKSDEIIVPDYSEYTGISDALEKAGLGEVVNIATGPHNTQVKIFKITHPEALAEIEKLNSKKKKEVQKAGPEM